MKVNLEVKNEPKEELCATLSLVRQAAQNLPPEHEEIYDDLKWVEESLVALMSENEEIAEDFYSC